MAQKIQVSEKQFYEQYARKVLPSAPSAGSKAPPVHALRRKHTNLGAGRALVATC
jgi:hypothetical protein